MAFVGDRLKTEGLFGKRGGMTTPLVLAGELLEAIFRLLKFVLISPQSIHMNMIVSTDLVSLHDKHGTDILAN